MEPSEIIRTIHGPDADVDIWAIGPYGFVAYVGDKKVSGSCSEDYEYVIRLAFEAAGFDPDDYELGD